MYLKSGDGSPKVLIDRKRKSQGKINYSGIF